jgi:hypothetical protein
MLSNVGINSSMEVVNEDGAKWSNCSYEKTEEKEKKGGRTGIAGKKTCTK